MQDIFELFSRGDVYLVGGVKGEGVAIPLNMNDVRIARQADPEFMGPFELEIKLQISNERRVTIIDGEVPEEIRKTVLAWQRMNNACKNKA